MSDINLGGFSEASSWILDRFSDIVSLLTHVKILNVSLLAWLIAFVIIDLIFSAVYVTFNVSGGSSETFSDGHSDIDSYYTDLNGEVHHSNKYVESSSYRNNKTRSRRYGFGFRR